MKIAFLDRDGTLNRERGFVTKPTELEILDGAVEAVQALDAAGFRLVVFTNQSGIARGLYTEADLARIHEALHAALSGLPAAYLHCPHHPDAGDHPYGGDCSCRKPNTGLLDQAERLFGDIDWESSCLVGDSARDLWTGRDRALTKILLKSGRPWRDQLLAMTEQGQPPDHIAEDLREAVSWILSRPG